MPATRENVRFEVPLYTLAEAARALSIPASTFANWAKGYTRVAGGRTTVGEPVVTSLGAVGGPTVPFVGLAEGMVLAAVRRAGVPMQRVRPALEVLGREIGVAHALASKQLYTDGAELLFDYASTSDDGDALRNLVVVRSGQRVFEDVIEAYLQRIDYGPDGYAKLIRLPAYDVASVVADPRRAFGQPIFEHGGARLDDVLERFWAGDSIEELADEFGVPPVEVEDVLRAASRRAA